MYDVHGNVCEWCWDTADWKNNRVTKGGSWALGSEWLDPKAVLSYNPASKFPDIGFRVVRIPLWLNKEDKPSSKRFSPSRLQIK